MNSWFCVFLLRSKQLLKLGSLNSHLQTSSLLNLMMGQMCACPTITIRLLLASLMSQYCFDGSRLSSSVTLPAGGPAGGVDGRRAGGRARGRSGDRHCTAGQYGYIPLGRHLVVPSPPDSISEVIMFSSVRPLRSFVHSTCLDRSFTTISSERLEQF